MDRKVSKQPKEKGNFLKLLFFILLVALCGMGINLSSASGEPFFEINGYYLGATPEELGVTVESDAAFEKKYYESSGDGARLFFVRHKDRLRSYRIIVEISAKRPPQIQEILSQLKKKYGIPKMQLIKTSSVRKEPMLTYRTTVNNKAVWKISESQEFFAVVEPRRITLELIDHNPEKIKIIQKPDSLSDEGFMIDDGWDPDY
jgi:hypothetical protein